MPYSKIGRHREQNNFFKINGFLELTTRRIKPDNLEHLVLFFELLIQDNKISDFKKKNPGPKDLVILSFPVHVKYRGTLL